MLEIKGITKRFGGLTAVDAASFVIEQGESVALIGPNGAGKTTLFNVITGFEAPDEGYVRLGGESITGRQPNVLNEKGIARSFQIPRPFSDLTVAQNLLVACQSPRVRTKIKSFDKRVKQIAQQVTLGDRLHMPASTLTVGELKRLEVGRVLATDPDVMMLDEPFAGLTSGEVARLDELLVSLRREDRILLIVEHRLREVFRMVERVVVMDQGRVIADGTPARVVKDPAVMTAYFGEKGARNLGLT